MMYTKLLIYFPIPEARQDYYGKVFVLDIHHSQVGIRLLKFFPGNHFLATLFLLLVPK